MGEISRSSSGEFYTTQISEPERLYSSENTDGAAAMHLPWKLVVDALLLVWEALGNDMTPPKFFTSLTLFDVVMIYHLRPTTTPAQQVTLGAIEAAFLVLWTLGILLLHLTGVQ